MRTKEKEIGLPFKGCRELRCQVLHQYIVFLENYIKVYSTWQKHYFAQHLQFIKDTTSNRKFSDCQNSMIEMVVISWRWGTLGKGLHQQPIVFS